MTRYIEADVLISIFEAKAQMGVASGYDICFYNAAKMVEILPAADVAPVRHGKWTMQRTEKHDGEWYCTACDYEPQVFENSKYCPNCGAKMVLED